MYLMCAGNDQKAAKPNYTRNGAHGKGNQHANDNLPHDTPFIVLPPTKVNSLS
jgi:hypothetical protein